MKIEPSDGGNNDETDSSADADNSQQQQSAADNVNNGREDAMKALREDARYQRALAIKEVVNTNGNDFNFVQLSLPYLQIRSAGMIYFFTALFC